MNEILNLIESNSKLRAKEIAAMIGKEEGDIKIAIEKYENDGVILGYHTIIDWDKTDREYVTAIIEIKITPQRDRGFDKIAERIYNYPEVQSLYLMSGSYDLAVIIEGKTMKEVAYFVAQKLAPIEDVVSTATHFVLRKYKADGVVYGASEEDLRGVDFI
ncbi:MAG: Lrp/AsnC family transcriptional regulator [Clostridia bacterium]|nr:Lrp/AsnC family transcriptional regulator [Clostridia bacterium]